MSTSNDSSNDSSTETCASTPAITPEPLCISRLAKKIMERYQDEWIIAVAVATTEAQSAIERGASEAEAHDLADRLIADYKRVDAELSAHVADRFRDPDYANEGSLDLRAGVLIALATGQSPDDLIVRIRARFQQPVPLEPAPPDTAA